jgi:hypothetical protein
MSVSTPSSAPVLATPAPTAHVTATATAAAARRVAGARRARTTRLLGSAAWTSAAVAVLLWATSDAARVTGDGRVLIVLGIIAGLIGTDFVLVMLVLAARVPLIDRLVGHDQAMALHGRLGKPALYLLLAHGALLVVGYSLDFGEGIEPMMVALWEATDVRLAILALAALIAVVVTSVKRHRSEAIGAGTSLEHH